MRHIALIALALASIFAQAGALIVDDFPTEVNWQSTWVEALDQIDIAAETISADLVLATDPSEPDLVLWNCGNVASTPLNPAEREWIGDFLASGGNLLLCASNLPGDLIPDNRDWLTENLGCDFVMPNSPITWSSVYSDHRLVGLDSTPVAGLSFDLEFGQSADVPADDLHLIHTTDDQAFHLVSFADMAGYLGVARETPRNRTALLTFPIDSVVEPADRTEIIQRLGEWLTRPRHEGRGIWVVRNQMTSASNIDEIVDACADAGFNSLFVQVRGRGDAYYTSATEPRSEALAGAPEDFDPLQHTIDRAHARGLEVHAWLNAGYTWLKGNLPADPQHIINRHPEFVMVNRAGRSQIDFTAEDFTATHSEGRYLSLAAPEVHDYLSEVYGEVVENYDVDGIHFDFIRYCARGVTEANDLDYNPLVIAAFEAEHGFDPHSVAIDSPQFETWQQWQREQVGELVGRIREEAHATRPGIRVSAAVLSRYHLGRVQATQDWIAWLAAGQLDTACIMAYREDNPLVVQLALLAQENRGQGSIWVGMGASHSIDDIVDRIDMVRDVVNPEGVMFFPWGGFDDNELDRLRDDPFVAPATAPPVADTTE